MSTRIQKFTLMAVAALAVLAAADGPVRAQQKPAPTAMASVDLRRVFDNYKGKTSGSEQVQALGQGLDKVLERLVSGSAAILPENEARELAGLYEKPNTTDAEKQRITALERKATGLADELRNLQNVAAPNDQQRARLSELTTSFRRGNDAIEGLKQNYQTRLGKLQQDLSDKITDDMRKAIAQVARDRNLAVVFDAAIAIYTANDITDDVLKALNK